MNLKDPITNGLSEHSKKKLGKSVKKGRKEGKYKTKYDYCKIEQYDYFGKLIQVFDNKDHACKMLKLSKKKIQSLAGGYRKGLV